MKMIHFFRQAYRDNALRRPEDRRQPWRDVPLYLRNLALRPWERRLARRYLREDLPLIFLVGVPRSGTTLLFQLIARHLDVGFPSNFIARYWMALVVGARRFRRHRAAGPTGALESRFGHARGAGAPHELSWFWHYWTPFETTDCLTDDELARLDWTGARRELLALAGWFGRPLVLKSLNWADYQVPWLADVFPQARFVWIRRDPAYVVQSILEVREQRYGDARIWWSVRPRDVAAWSERDPADQVVHQVRDITAALDRAFAGLPAERGLTLDYEDLVSRPAERLAELAAFVGTEAGGLEDLTALESANRLRADDARWAAIHRALEDG